MPRVPAHDDTLHRLDVRVRGQVQGVGFRPYVYRLARELELTGWVLNDGQGVRIQVQGVRPRLARFLQRVRRGPQRLSRVDRLEIARLGPRSERDFEIHDSEHGAIGTGLTPDTAVCSDCLQELFDASDRRYRYPFINCTQCGPRFTIIARLPYDRARTSMADFTLCARCAAEYGEPGDRRFHAEPNACARCGPTLSLWDADGNTFGDRDPIAAALAELASGRIVALKSLGGFHLACDARNPRAVARLRERKHRDAKPFALMLAGLTSVREAVDVDASAASLLESAERPIVLLSKRQRAADPFDAVAPGVGMLGVMLPYTPLHYLLFHEAAGRPPGIDWLTEVQSLALVMTSANAPGEPLVIDNRDAVRRLRGIADAFLVHDRDIVTRCDDSVVRANARAPIIVRRARGLASQPLALPATGPSMLAVGGGLKNTVCLTRDDQAFVSQHLGDLDSRRSIEAFEQTVSHLVDALGVRPERVVRDLHPDYASSRFAERFAHDHGLPIIDVQHHHAHVAAVAGEHGLEGPLLGLALDGVGLGSDGTPWGGELLLLEDGCERIGHLRALALPGGDAAAREPWRIAAGVLHALGRTDEIERRWPGQAGRVLCQMLERDLRCPRTSSAGRLFDAAAALLGLRDRSSYEAQAAMELEAVASSCRDTPVLDDGYRIVDGNVLDLFGLLAHLVETNDSALGAACFHATFATALAAWVERAASARGIDRVVLAGGCMLNVLLAERLRSTLEAAGLEVFEAETLPPNDGGLSFGQACAVLRDGD